MSNTRKHHYISQFYLRNFAAPTTGASLLYVVDKPLQKLFSTSTVNVAQERDFHRIDVIGYEPNTIKDALAQFEGQVATSLKAILARGYVGDDENANTLFYYMALLLVKNPAMRSQMDDVAHQVLTMIAKTDAVKLARFRGHFPLSGEGSTNGQKTPESLPTGIPAEDRRARPSWTAA